MTTESRLTPLCSTFVNAMNTQDSASFIACFSPEAIVEDEGHAHQGTEAIKAWIERAFASYQPILEVKETSVTDSGAIITGIVSGTFPGSPVTLNYHLSIAQDQITGLRCVA
jgi:hypothetical protein